MHGRSGLRRQAQQRLQNRIEEQGAELDAASRARPLSRPVETERHPHRFGLPRRPAAELHQPADAAGDPAQTAGARPRRRHRRDLHPAAGPWRRRRCASCAPSCAACARWRVDGANLVRRACRRTGGATSRRKAAFPLPSSSGDKPVAHGPQETTSGGGADDPGSPPQCAEALRRPRAWRWRMERLATKALEIAIDDNGRGFSLQSEPITLDELDMLQAWGRRASSGAPVRRQRRDLTSGIPPGPGHRPEDSGFPFAMTRLAGRSCAWPFPVASPVAVAMAISPCTRELAGRRHAPHLSAWNREPKPVLARARRPPGNGTPATCSTPRVVPPPGALSTTSTPASTAAPGTPAHRPGHFRRRPAPGPNRAASSHPTPPPPGKASLHRRQRPAPFAPRRRDSGTGIRPAPGGTPQHGPGALAPTAASWTEARTLAVAPCRPARQLGRARLSADPYVIRIGEPYFYLYYLGQDRARRQRLGLARSRDGASAGRSCRSSPVLELGGAGSRSMRSAWESPRCGRHTWLVLDALHRPRRLPKTAASAWPAPVDGVACGSSCRSFFEASADPWDSRTVLCDPDRGAHARGRARLVRRRRRRPRPTKTSTARSVSRFLRPLDVTLGR